MTKQTTKIPSIQSLKKQAIKVAKQKKFSLSQAQDDVAKTYGFTHWALLMKYFNSVQMNSIEKVWTSLGPSEVMLLSAQQGVGKLSMALNLAFSCAFGI